MYQQGFQNFGRYFPIKNGFNIFQLPPIADTHCKYISNKLFKCIICFIEDFKEIRVNIKKQNYKKNRKKHIYNKSLCFSLEKSKIIKK